MSNARDHQHGTTPDPSRQPLDMGELPAPDRVIVVHYECESFSKVADDARPTAIVLRDSATGELVRIPGEDERALLADLAAALERRAGEHVVTWNMGDAGRYGWAALGRRAAQHAVELSPPHRHLDLARWLWKRHGNDYIPHGDYGRLHELATRNNLPTRGWHEGTEAGPWAGSVAQRLHRCAVKAAAIEGVLRLTVAGTLRVEAAREAAEGPVQARRRGAYRLREWAPGVYDWLYSEEPAAPALDVQALAAELRDVLAPTDGGEPEKRSKKALALRVVTREPGIPDAELARRVGVNPSTVSREWRDELRTARALAAKNLPRGWKVGGELEAEDPAGAAPPRNTARKSARKKPG